MLVLLVVLPPPTHPHPRPHPLHNTTTAGPLPLREIMRVERWNDVPFLHPHIMRIRDSCFCNRLHCPGQSLSLSGPPLDEVQYLHMSRRCTLQLGRCCLPFEAAWQGVKITDVMPGFRVKAQCLWCGTKLHRCHGCWISSL